MTNTAKYIRLTSWENWKNFPDFESSAFHFFNIIIVYLNEKPRISNKEYLWGYISHLHSNVSGLQGGTTTKNFIEKKT